jgi:peptidylprolyl isomerase
MNRALTLAAFSCLLGSAACGGPQTAEPQTAAESGQPSVTKEDLVVGSGPEVKRGDHVTVHYTGSLTDGTVFDSSVERGTPFDYTAGIGQVIPGWDLGVVGMKKGGKRKLTIPPNLAYGARGVPGKIPPNATLLFQVEILDVQPGTETPGE